MPRPWDSDDILAERKRADEMYELGYKAGYKAGYRQARMDILGKEVVLQEEAGYDALVKSVIEDIRTKDGE